MRKITFLFFYFSAIAVNAQTDSSKQKLKLSAYLDMYDTYDFANPGNHTRPTFLYNYTRTNEVNLNLGYIKASLVEKNVRANLAFSAGTYMNANYVNEVGVMKNVFEANLGVKLSSKKALWIDAGIFPSHIGFESAISKDCWTLTRSILAENSPYYESGVRLSYTTSNEKWYLSMLLLNGWQVINRVDGNNALALGHQVTFQPSQAVLFNSSSFIGNVYADSISRMRYFHNFYTVIQFSSKWGITTGFDIGLQQKHKYSNSLNNWYGYVVILQWKPTEKNAIGLRVENYNDPNNIIIPKGFNNGFNTFGYSLNYDQSILPNLLWRIEARYLYNSDNYFTNNNMPVNNNVSICTALQMSF